MRERTLFLIMILIVIVMTIIETGHDYNAILAGAKDGVWKLWGNAYDFLWIAIVVISIYYYGGVIRFWSPPNRVLLWIPILWLVWWIVHDMFMGIWLTGDPLYIGIGKADSWLGAIFLQSGLLYLGFKSLWLFLGIGTYLRLSRESW